MKNIVVENMVNGHQFKKLGGHEFTDLNTLRDAITTVVTYMVENPEVRISSNSPMMKSLHTSTDGQIRKGLISFLGPHFKDEGWMEGGSRYWVSRMTAESFLNIGGED